MSCNEQRRRNKCLTVTVCVLRLRRRPQTLADLIASLKLLETLQASMTKTEAQIPMIHDQFALLDKYEVTLDQTVSTSSNQRQARTNAAAVLRSCHHHLLCWPAGARHAREPERGVGVVPARGDRQRHHAAARKGEVQEQPRRLPPGVQSEDPARCGGLQQNRSLTHPRVTVCKIHRTVHRRPSSVVKRSLFLLQVRFTAQWTARPPWRK